MRKIRERSFCGRGEAPAEPFTGDRLGRSLALPESDSFLIDLSPLLAEIAAGAISDADELQAATEFPHHSENRTLLVSPQDQAVFLSQWKHWQDRVGYVPPVTIVPGIDTIEVGGFDLLDLEHGYFASAKPLIEDIREAIETKKTARERTIPQAFGDHFTIDVRSTG